MHAISTRPRDIGVKSLPPIGGPDRSSAASGAQFEYRPLQNPPPQNWIW
jgi:hypothetical protein